MACLIGSSDVPSRVVTPLYACAVIYVTRDLDPRPAMMPVPACLRFAAAERRHSMYVTHSTYNTCVRGQGTCVRYTTAAGWKLLLSYAKRSRCGCRRRRGPLVPRRRSAAAAPVGL